MPVQNAIGFFESLGVQPVTFNDWFLPSKDELNAMYTELHLHGVGGFIGSWRWSSSETAAAVAYTRNFSTGGQVPPDVDPVGKWNGLFVRGCRAFISTTNYNLRDTGQAGGLIFWKSGNDYLEAAPSDCAISAWSNINNVAIGVTAQGTAIGTGQSNTTAIINQIGHIGSAAKLCNDLVITH